MQKLIAMAKANIPLMDGTIDPVLDLVFGNDVVFAVFADSELEHGFGTLIIKGRAMLTDSEDELPDRTNAIPCESFEHAYAIWEALGESDTLH